MPASKHHAYALSAVQAPAPPFVGTTSATRELLRLAEALKVPAGSLATFNRFGSETGSERAAALAEALKSALEGVRLRGSCLW